MVGRSFKKIKEGWEIYRGTFFRCRCNRSTVFRFDYLEDSMSWVHLYRLYIADLNTEIKMRGRNVPATNSEIGTLEVKYCKRRLGSS